MRKLEEQEELTVTALLIEKCIKMFYLCIHGSGWLGFGGKQAQEDKKETKKPKIEPATSLAYRYVLRTKHYKHFKRVICTCMDCCSVTFL